jgi:hypothetical protein
MERRLMACGSRIPFYSLRDPGTGGNVSAAETGASAIRRLPIGRRSVSRPRFRLLTNRLPERFDMPALSRDGAD